MVDDFTNLSFSAFYETKNGMIEPACEQFKLWEQTDKPVRTIRCDNAGENVKLQKRIKSKDCNFNTKFQYTGRATPQQNGKVEKKIATITERGDSMMNAANLKLEERCKLCKEACRCSEHFRWTNNH